MNCALIVFISAPQLQALIADTMDTLEGKRTDQEREWNAMQKVNRGRKVGGVTSSVC